MLKYDSFKYRIAVILILALYLGGCGLKQEQAQPVSVNSSGSSGTYHWNSVSPLVISFPNTRKATIETSVYSAVYEWNNAIGKSFVTYRFTDFNEDVSSKNLLATQGTLRVYFKGAGEWSAISTNNSALAVTFYSHSNDILVDADIVFNGNFSFSYGSTTNYSSFDFQSVLTHELGHFLGLPHISEEVDSLSIMNPTLFSGQQKRSLSNDDITNIKKLY